MKAKLLAVVLGLSLASGTALACPSDQFQRQGGSFKWMVSGQYNGQDFTRQGQGLRSLRQLYRQHVSKRGQRRGDGDRGQRRRPNLQSLTVKVKFVPARRNVLVPTVN